MPRVKLTEITYNPPTLFGQFLYHELKQGKMYLQDFAAYLGIPRKSLVRFLETDAQPSMDTLLDISVHMNVNFLMLVVLARPDSARMIVQQLRKEMSDVEQRLVANHMLPEEMEDLVRSTLTREVEEQLYDALMVIDNALYVMSHNSQADKAQMVAICERNLKRILNVLGVER